MDMVCEKEADSGHDFDRDPIRVLRDGDRLRGRNHPGGGQRHGRGLCAQHSGSRRQRSILRWR